MHFRSKIRIAVQIGKWESNLGNGKWESRCELRSKMGIKKQIGLSKQNHKANENLIWEMGIRFGIAKQIGKWEAKWKLRSKIGIEKHNGNYIGSKIIMHLCTTSTGIHNHTV